MNWEDEEFVGIICDEFVVKETFFRKFLIKGEVTFYYNGIPFIKPCYLLKIPNRRVLDDIEKEE